jgi:hypothetical protein
VKIERHFNHVSCGVNSHRFSQVQNTFHSHNNCYLSHIPKISSAREKNRRLSCKDIANLRGKKLFINFDLKYPVK